MLIGADFIIKKVIDDVELLSTITGDSLKWYSAQKATMIPATYGCLFINFTYL